MPGRPEKGLPCKGEIEWLLPVRSWLEETNSFKRFLAQGCERFLAKIGDIFSRAKESRESSGREDEFSDFLSFLTSRDEGEKVFVGGSFF